MLKKFDEFNEGFMQKSTLDQLKKLRKQTKGTDIDDRVKKDLEKVPDRMWHDNPIDRNVDTYQSYLNEPFKTNQNRVTEAISDVDYKDYGLKIRDDLKKDILKFLNKYNIGYDVKDIDYFFLRNELEVEKNHYMHFNIAIQELKEEGDILVDSDKNISLDIRQLT